MKSRVLVLGAVSLMGCVHGVEVLDDHRLKKEGVVELGCGEQTVLRLPEGKAQKWGPNLTVTRGSDGLVLDGGLAASTTTTLVSVQAVGPGGSIDNVWVRSRCRVVDPVLSVNGSLVQFGFVHSAAKKADGKCEVRPSAIVRLKRGDEWASPPELIQLGQDESAQFCHASPCTAEAAHITTVTCK